MPHEGYANPVKNDGPGFHSDMPVSELAERETRAIEASVVSLAPLVAETKDGVTHETRPTPTEPHRGSGDQRSAHGGPEAASCRTRDRGENTDEPLWPHLDLLVRS